MSGFKVDITVHTSGPLFSGWAEAEAAKVVEAAGKELADTGGRDIKAAADAMDRSGRGGTGRAAAGVITRRRPYGWLIYGDMIKGQVWWPWLEGSSKRNSDTRFRGYHTFRKESARLRATAGDVMEKHLAEHIRSMGGEVG